MQKKMRKRTMSILAVLALLTVVIGAYNVPRSLLTHIEYRSEMPARDGWLICVIGDPGTGAPVQHAVAKAMFDAKCDDVRIVGDIIYPSGISDVDDPQLRKKFFDSYQMLLDAEIPVSVVLGNHDYKGNDLAWLELAERTPGLHMPFFNYAERFNDGMCIISIDTTWVDKFYFTNRHIALIDWLTSTLEALKGKCAFSLALGHHPLRSSGLHEQPTPATRWFVDQFVVGHVDAYVAGHEHNLSDEGVRSKTHLLVSGAGGKHTGAQSPGPETRFAIDQCGFLAIRLQQRAETSGTLAIAADYAFHVVEPRSDSDGFAARVAWRGKISGQGVR
jgi:hypothetical protein